MNNLYTFILDYDSGTFVSQFEGNSIYDAYDKWLKDLPLSEMNVASNAEICPDGIEDRFSKISGLENAWCTTLDVANKMATATVVLTRIT